MLDVIICLWFALAGYNLSSFLSSIKETNKLISESRLNRAIRREPVSRICLSK